MSQEKKVEKKEMKKPDGLVEVTCPDPIHINGIQYHGTVKVSVETAQTLIPMVQAKHQTDLEIFVGKSRLVQKVAGKLKITEGGI